MWSIIGASVTLALAGMILPAQAQDLTDWSGFYAGIYSGYALDADGASASSTGPLAVNLGGAVLNGSFSNGDGRIAGIIGGLNAGYNYQHNNLVLGLETGINVGQYGKTDSTSLSGTATAGGNTLTASFDQSATYDINWYTNLVGRVGVAYGNWLFTLKGGVVFADASIKASSALHVDDPGGLILPAGTVIDVPGASSASKLLIGPTFGIGAEAMVAENVSVSAEYGYIGLPDLSAPAPGIGGLFGGGGSVFTGAIHQLKAGVKYHF